MDDQFYATPAMFAVFTPEAHIRQLLRFEGALAQAQARVGIIPQEAADAITSGCATITIDTAELYQQAALAGTIAIPLVRMLTQHVAAAGRSYVHWGATSQDAIDTALMLQIRAGIELLEADLLRVCAACAGMAATHRHTLMVGRTLLQHALPITFGLKAARWLALATRQLEALQMQAAQLTLQFGGAAGTLAALGDAGLQVAAFLATDLGLLLPDLPWHAERDRMARIAATVGISATAAAKIAQDIVLLAQSEVAEVSELRLPGKGGSSAMPQKQNPIDATIVLASAQLALGQVQTLFQASIHEHERAAGAWQTEWAAIPSLFRYTSGAIGRIAQALEGLQIDPTRMQANIDLSNGLLMAESLTMVLAAHLGRQEAQQLVQTLVQQTQQRGSTLLATAQDDDRVLKFVSPTAIATALDPIQYLGSTDELIDRALAGYQALKQ